MNSPPPSRSLLARVRSSDGPRDSYPLLKRQRLRASSRLDTRGFEHGRRAASRLDARAQVCGRGAQVVEDGLATLREARADDAPEQRVMSARRLALAHAQARERAPDLRHGAERAGRHVE